MRIACTKEAEGPHLLRPNNPFVPPKGAVSFINNLPVELLLRIFEFVFVDDGDFLVDDNTASIYWDRLDLLHLEATEQLRDEDGGVLEKTEDSFPQMFPFQIFISHVCSHWRNILLSTPTFWRTVKVCSVAGRSYELESTFLERSGNIPINVSVDCLVHKTGDSIPSEAEVKSLCSMLVPHIHRLRTMEVMVPDYDLMFVLLNAMSDPSIATAPQLTSLRLYHDTEEEPEEFDSFWYPNMSKPLTLFSGSAPLLTKVVLWKVHVDWNQQWITSASNLRDLELAFHTDDVRPSWAQFVNILCGAPILQKLTLRRSGPSGDPAEWFIEPTPESPADFNAPIKLLQLTDLVLTSHSQARVVRLLRELYLPSLRNMVLILTDGDHTALIPQLAAPATPLALPLIREQPRSLLSGLESLRIILPCLPNHVEALRSELRNATSLDISLWAVPSPSLQILGTRHRLPGRGDVWLPQCKTLYVCGATGRTLREIVRSRMAAGVPLSSLYVERTCEIDEEDLNWLQDNLETFRRTWD